MAQDFFLNVYFYLSTCGSQCKLFAEQKSQFLANSPTLCIKPSYLSVMVKSLILSLVTAVCKIGCPRENLHPAFFKFFSFILTSMSILFTALS